MLIIEVSLPHACVAEPLRVEACAGLPDLTLYVLVKLCAYCREPFIARKRDHRFCDDPRCKRQFHREKPVTGFGVGC